MKMAGMERNSFNSKYFKSKSIMARQKEYLNNNNGNNNNVTNSSSDIYGNEDHLLGELFSWPPRSYICSFCKREFRSAQALGGHMNVHRRDRAMLRQSPPRDITRYSLLNLNLEPNPNSYPNNNTGFTRKFPPFEMTKLGKRVVPNNHLKTAKGLFGVEKIDSFMQEKQCSTKKSEFLRLELEIGLISESKEDLDLELRLGYS